MVFYLPAELREAVEEKGNVQTKLRQVATFACALGLMCPNERTYALMVALILFADIQKISGDSQFSTLQLMKPRIKHLLASGSGEALEWVDVLPHDPANFMEHYPGYMDTFRALYGNTCIPEPGWPHADAVRRIAMQMPLRRCNAELVQFPQGRPENAMFSQMMSVMSSMLQTRGSSPSAGIELQFLQPKPAERPGQLMLTDVNQNHNNNADDSQRSSSSSSSANAAASASTAVYSVHPLEMVQRLASRASLPSVHDYDQVDVDDADAPTEILPGMDEDAPTAVIVCKRPLLLLACTCLLFFVGCCCFYNCKQSKYFFWLLKATVRPSWSSCATAEEKGQGSTKGGTCSA